MRKLIEGYKCEYEGCTKDATDIVYSRTADVSRKVSMAVALSMCVPRRVIKEMADREQAVSDGKMKAILCGQPDWKNACLSCGKVEIDIGETECTACSLKIR